MKNIVQRLNRLEAHRRPTADGPWNWPAKAAEVRRRAFAALSAEERAWLPNVYDNGDRGAREGEVWDRFVSAFNRAVEEVPAPHLMCTADLFGQW
jgi:hypothetical protein